jgi:hypothetical protein
MSFHCCFPNLRNDFDCGFVLEQYDITSISFLFLLFEQLKNLLSIFDNLLTDPSDR